MTIVADFGDWWIEYLDLDITTQDGAGQYTADIALTRGGRHCGHSVSIGDAPNLDVAQNLGMWGIFRALPAPAIELAYGTALTSVRGFIEKAVSTSGAIPLTLKIILFMRR